jgi:hypothetical protein
LYKMAMSVSSSAINIFSDLEEQLEVAVKSTD